MHDGAVRVDTGDDVREFPCDALLSMIEGDLRELNDGSGDAGIGLTLRAGNSSQTDWSGRVEVKRETPLTVLLFSCESA